MNRALQLAAGTFLAMILAGRAMAQEPSALPLPDAATLIEKLIEQSAHEDENDRQFRERYAFTRIKVTEERSRDGRLKSREERKGINNPSAARLRRSAVPSTTQLATTIGPPAPTAGTSTNASNRQFARNDFLLNRDLVNRFDFTMAGREEMDGRPVLVLDFKPADKKLPVHSFKDRFINKAAGRVWVDEAECVLTKADLHLTDSVNVVGGLVGSVGKFTYRFERERTMDGLWFTRSVNWHLEGREIFSRKLMDYEERKEGVRKVF